MKLKALLMLLWLPLTALAQTTQIEAVIIDAQTRQPLPYASIFISRANSTITNAEGKFHIFCSPDDVLRISYVGYKTQQITARNLSSKIQLEPITSMLNEVTIMPLKAYLDKAIKETMRQIGKYHRKKANLFYRQTAYADSTCYEFMEAFLNGRSAVWLRNLALNKGRFVGIQPDSLDFYSFYANFFILSQIQVTCIHKSQLQGDERYPLIPTYEKNYDVTGEWIGDGDDRLLVVHFTPKPTKLSVIDATLYFDGQTLRLRKMEGRLLNLTVRHYKYLTGKRRESSLVEAFKNVRDEYINTDFHFTVTMTEDRGFLEVQSVAIDEQHEFHGRKLHSNSILFNVGDRVIGKGKKLKKDDNILIDIGNQEYDPQFWSDNDIVRRTPLEEDVFQLFESKKLFGVFK